MSTLAPYEVNVPGTKDWQPMLDRSEQSPLHYWMGLILGRGWRAVLVAIVIFSVIVGFVSQMPRTYYAEGSVLVHDNMVATHVFRIAQEAIGNAIKHGKAKTIMVDLAVNSGQLCMNS